MYFNPTSPDQSLEGSSSRRFSRRGFTLTEILVVIGLIILLLALAMPAFNFMSGNNSIEGSANTVSAIFSRVRQDAIALQKDRGVVFYFDVAENRLVAGFVEYKEIDDAYSPTASYLEGSYVLSGGDRWVCIDPHKGGYTPSIASKYWRKVTVNNSALNAIASTARGYRAIDLVPQVDRIVLNKSLAIGGIGGQRIAATGVTVDPEENLNYAMPAVFFFDSYGQLVHRRYSILLDGIIGNAAGLREEFDKLKTNSDPKRLWRFGGPNEQIFNVSQSALSLFNSDDAQNVTQNVSDEEEVNKWYAENTRPFLINRYNGTLMKGE